MQLGFRRFLVTWGGVFNDEIMCETVVCQAGSVTHEKCLSDKIDRANAMGIWRP